MNKKKKTQEDFKEQFRMAKKNLKKIKQTLRNVTEKPTSSEINELSVWESGEACNELAMSEVLSDE